jgi:hypothetical protein
MQVLACATLLRVLETWETVGWNLGLHDILSISDDCAVGSSSTGENPDVLLLEEEVGFAWINNWIVSVVGVQHAVVTGSEQEEPDFALGTLALSWSLYVIYLSLIVLGVVNTNDSIISEIVFRLGAIAVLEENALIPGVLVPRSSVLRDVEWLLKSRLRAPAPAKPCWSCADEGNDCDEESWKLCHLIYLFNYKTKLCFSLNNTQIKQV